MKAMKKNIVVGLVMLALVLPLVSFGGKLPLDEKKNAASSKSMKKTSETKAVSAPAKDHPQAKITKHTPSKHHVSKHHHQPKAKIAKHHSKKHHVAKHHGNPKPTRSSVK
jgi:hypothetical protein